MHRHDIWEDFRHSEWLQTRRSFLRRSALSIGSLALGTLLRREAVATPGTVDGKTAAHGVVDPLHFPPKVKRIVHLCMAGGPSHLETLDYKPKLAEMQSGRDRRPIGTMRPHCSATGTNWPG